MRPASLAAVAACLVIAACATTPNVRLTQAKGMATAWASLDAVAVQIDNLAVTHQLHGQKAQEASVALLKARDALTAADAAYRAGNGASGAQNAALASSLIASLLVIVTETQGGH